VRTVNSLLLVLAFSLTYFTAIESHAKGTKDSCEHFYSKSLLRQLKAASISYIKEIHQTRGGALLVREPRKEVEYPIPMFAAANPNKWLLDKAIQYVPNRLTARYAHQTLDFRPALWFTEKVVQKSARAVSAKLLGKTKEISSLMIFAASIGTSIMAYDYVVDRIEQRTEVNRQVDIQKKSPEYNLLLASDYRFTSLRDSISKLNLTESDRTLVAYHWNETLREFYSYVDSKYNQTVQYDYRRADQELMNQTKFGPIIFADINKIAKDGIRGDLPGFTYQTHFSTALSDKQVNQLVGMRIEMLSKMEMASHYVYRTETYQKLKNEPSMSAIFKEWDQDAFIQNLRRIEQQGTINSAKVRFLIQEDLFWRNKFFQWQVIGVTRLKKEGERYTQLPLTIEDIQRDTLSELSSQPTKMKD